MKNHTFKTTEIVNLFQIEQLVVFYSHGATSTTEWDRHAHHELYALRQGELTIEVGDRSFTLRPGECLLTSPNRPHRIVARSEDTRMNLCGFHCTGTLLLPLCERVLPLSESDALLLNEVTAEGVRCFETMPVGSSEVGCRVRDGITRGRLQALKNRLEIFLIRLIEAYAADLPATRRTTVADGVHNYLLAHLTERVTLEEIAASLSLSVPYVKRRYREQYGKGIIHAMLEMKIARAKELMEETTLNFTQIADYLSFESENHFSKTFKKHTGQTPREWRNYHE